MLKSNVFSIKFHFQLPILWNETSQTFSREAAEEAPKGLHVYIFCRLGGLFFNKLGNWLRDVDCDGLIFIPFVCVNVFTDKNCAGLHEFEWMEWHFNSLSDFICVLLN